jgi:putative oxidoreductase
VDEFNDAMLLLRLFFGLMLLAHGYNHFFRGGRIAGTGRWFESIGVKPGRLNAIVASTVEVGGGALLAAGLLTSFAGAAAVGLMVVAYATVHRFNGFFIVKEGWEYVASIAVVGIAIAMLGPGEWSLDHAVGIDDKLDGWVGLAIAAGLGIGGGLAQLAVFYRPPAKKD